MLRAGSNMRDEIKSILNLFEQIIKQSGWWEMVMKWWLNLNSWREQGLYGFATHCYLVSTKTRRLDKHDDDDDMDGDGDDEDDTEKTWGWWQMW